MGDLWVTTGYPTITPPAAPYELAPGQVVVHPTAPPPEWHHADTQVVEHARRHPLSDPRLSGPINAHNQAAHQQAQRQHEAAAAAAATDPADQFLSQQDQLAQMQAEYAHQVAAQEQADRQAASALWGASQLQVPRPPEAAPEPETYGPAEGVGPVAPPVAIDIRSYQDAGQPDRPYMAGGAPSGQRHAWTDMLRMVGGDV
jgi:hypothetical protein